MRDGSEVLFPPLDHQIPKYQIIKPEERAKGAQDPDKQGSDFIMMKMAFVGGGGFSSTVEVSQMERMVDG